MYHAQVLSMEIKLTKTILIEIAYQILAGNPFWGLALLNRYRATPELRHQLQERFRARVGSQAHHSPIAKALLDGSSLAELSPEQARAVGFRSVRSVRSLPLPRRRHKSYRVCARDRRRVYAPPLPGISSNNQRRLSTISAEHPFPRAM